METEIIDHANMDYGSCKHGRFRLDILEIFGVKDDRYCKHWSLDNANIGEGSLNNANNDKSNRTNGKPKYLSIVKSLSIKTAIVAHGKLNSFELFRANSEGKFIV